MAIHPKFAERILSSAKRVEFRRRSTSRAVTHLVIYATSPICAVVGVAEIKRLERGSPGHLWASFHDVGGIDRDSFFAYFSGTTEGCAYVLGSVWKCAPPIPLGNDGLPQKPPQAFQYVEDGALQALLGKAKTLSQRGLARPCS
jgi:predicted transcriptional regulator